MEEPRPDVPPSVKSAAKRKRVANTDRRRRNRRRNADETDLLRLHFTKIRQTGKGRVKIVWRCRRCDYEYQPFKAGNTTDKEWWRSSAPGKHWKKHHKNAGNEDDDEANESEEPTDCGGGEAKKVRRLMRANCRLRQTNSCLQGEDCRQCWCTGAAESVPATFAHKKQAVISLAKVVPLSDLASSGMESHRSSASPPTSDMRTADNAGTATSADATNDKEEKRKEKNKKAAMIRRHRLKHPENENTQLLELQRQLVEDTGEGSLAEIDSLRRNYAHAKEFHGSLASTLKKYGQVEQPANADIDQTHGDIADFHSERQLLRKMIATLLEDIGRMEEALLQIRALLRSVMGVAISEAPTDTEGDAVDECGEGIAQATLDDGEYMITEDCGENIAQWDLVRNNLHTDCQSSASLQEVGRGQMLANVHFYQPACPFASGHYSRGQPEQSYCFTSGNATFGFTGQQPVNTSMPVPSNNVVGAYAGTTMRPFGSSTSGASYGTMTATGDPQKQTLRVPETYQGHWIHE